jgi:DNA-binding transcriptional LysR family regulator
LVLYVEALHKAAGPRWLEEHCGRARRVTRADSTEVARRVIASGGGIGVIPAMTTDGTTNLVRIFPEPVAFNTGWVVYHEAMRDTARVRAAAEVLLEFFEANAPLFLGSGTHKSA